jgi:hypothetical protein
MKIVRLLIIAENIATKAVDTKKIYSISFLHTLSPDQKLELL